MNGLKILDVGSGETPKLVSNYLEIDITYCDSKFGNNMEDLKYPDRSFDLVTCINALDHTKDALKALKELMRVGKYVYVNCAIDQKTRHRKKHYWDAKADGLFTNGDYEDFNLKDYGFEINFDDGRVIAKWSA